jgi:hypothetical protein
VSRDPETHGRLSDICYLECIAELTHKPLYNINSGDLGQESDIAQTRLQSIFERAKAWNAVLLLDEADVFLAKRSAGNIARNAFVSVFLRLLEYYPGIMFLTTNRMDEFDDAFQSRIHLTIEYKELGFKELTTIWRHNLRDAYGGTMPDGVTDSDLERLAKDFATLNGRQIKSLISLSRVVCEHDDGEEKQSLVSTIRTIHNLNERGKPQKKPSAETADSKAVGPKVQPRKDSESHIQPTNNELEAAFDALALRRSMPSAQEAVGPLPEQPRTTGGTVVQEPRQISNPPDPFKMPSRTFTF